MTDDVSGPSQGGPVGWPAILQGGAWPPLGGATAAYISNQPLYTIHAELYTAYKSSLLQLYKLWSHSFMLSGDYITNQKYLRADWKS